MKHRLHINVDYYVYCCRADIALIGLAVMGQNLVLNMNDHNFVVRIMCTRNQYNLTTIITY